MNRATATTLVKLVVYTVTTILATAVLLLIIVNGRTGDSTAYRADFVDAGGVASNDNVKIAGVAVGTVKDVSLAPGGTARVTFNVDREVALPEDVRVEIKYENLIGGRYLDLQRPSGPAAGHLAANSLIPTARTEPALNLTVLFGGFRPLFQALQPDQVNQLAEQILMTLQGEGGTVESLLTHTASLTQSIADRDEVIGDLITDLNSVLGTVSTRDDELSTLIVQLQRFVTGLSEDRDAIGSAVESVGELSTSVSGLLEEARPPLKDDIAELGGLAENLEEGKGTIDQQLNDLPRLLGRVNRTASYGSWFQFYLCDLGGIITSGSKQTEVTSYSNPAARCTSP